MRHEFSFNIISIKNFNTNKFINPFYIILNFSFLINIEHRLRRLNYQLSYAN